MSTYDFAKKHLFLPLNIKDSYWYSDGQGIHNGGDGLRLTSRDMEKLGFLYLSMARKADCFSSMGSRVDSAKISDIREDWVLRLVVFSSELYDHSLRPFALFRKYILAAE